MHAESARFLVIGVRIDDLMSAHAQPINSENVMRGEGCTLLGGRESDTIFYA